MHLIAIAGAAGSGKDSTASILESIFGFQRRAFADKVKIEVSEILAGISPIDAAAPHLVRLLLRENLGHPERAWEKPTTPEIRTLLQLYGTEYRRDQYGKDYWINRLGRLPGKAVITDLRFRNEMEFIRRLGGQCWLIDGRGEPSYAFHSSEADLSGEFFDLVIRNDSTLDDLKEKITQAMRRSW